MFRLFRGKREALKKYLLAAFLLIMALGMIGVVTPFFSGGDTSRVEMNVLAEVGDHTITVQDLQRTVQLRLKNTPQGFDSRLVPLLAGSLLDEMVLRYAIEIQARKLGLKVTPEELLEATQRISWLYSNGSFIGMDAYENQIQQQTGMTVAQFEAQLRESLLFDKIRATVTDGMQESPAEGHEEFVRRNAQKDPRRNCHDREERTGCPEPGQVRKGLRRAGQEIFGGLERFKRRGNRLDCARADRERV